MAVLWPCLLRQLTDGVLFVLVFCLLFLFSVCLGVSYFVCCQPVSVFHFLGVIWVVCFSFLGSAGVLWWWLYWCVGPLQI